MAKPPEPLEEIFPQTSLIVDATVLEVKSEEKVVDPNTVPKQIVVLEVARVVRGKLDIGKEKKLLVTKPAGAYKLRAGVKGPWLLSVDKKTGERTILGRYGPDSYTFDKIDAKLAELDPPHLRP